MNYLFICVVCVFVCLHAVIEKKKEFLGEGRGVGHASGAVVPILFIAIQASLEIYICSRILFCSAHLFLSGFNFCFH